MSELTRTASGRFISKKVLDSKLKRSTILAEARKRKKTAQEEEKTAEKRVRHESVCKGNRIIDVEELSNNLNCFHCQQRLDIKDIISEKLVGLHAVWTIKCNNCELVTEVPTGRKHTTKDNVINADINTRAVLGVLHSGSGLSAFNKLLICLDIPGLSNYAFKKYEKEVGTAFEEAINESSSKVAHEEQEIVIEQT